MAVSPPSAADDREAHEQAGTSAAERAEVARAPLYAALGAGEYAVSAVTKAVSDARTRAVDARGKASEQAHRMNGDELRKLLDDLRAQVEKVYSGFAERGEHTWEQWRAQPQFQQAVSSLKNYSGKLDAHVDTLVDEARVAGEKALGTVSRQTRSAGERVARSTQRFSSSTARAVNVAGEETAKVVAGTGSDVAEAIVAGGDELADGARSVSQTAANLTAPTAASPSTEEPAAEKPAVRKSPARRPATRKVDTAGDGAKES